MDEYRLQYLDTDGTEVPIEQNADEIRVWSGDDCVATLYRYQTSGRWVDVEPKYVDGKTILWGDVETYLRDPDGANLG